MMSITSLKSSVMPVLVLALLAGLWIGLSIYSRSKLALPSHVDTLAKFSAEMPQPEKVIAFDLYGSSYVELIGRPPRFPGGPVPSGPPAYIFDSTGHISYWTVDVGDSTEYWEDFQNRSNSREISIKEALELVKGVKE
jgi:hypothetical protein